MRGYSKPARGKCGISPVLSAAVISAIILAAGMAVYSIFITASSTWALEYHREIDRSVAKYQLALSVDYVKPLPDGNVKIWVRNYGETAAVILDAYAHLPETAPSSGHKITMNITIPVGSVRDVTVPCYGCGDELNGKDLIIRIFALPERLYNPAKPETYAQFGQYFVLKIRVLEA